MYQQYYLVYLTYNEIERLISMYSVTPVNNQAITTIRYCLNHSLNFTLLYLQNVSKFMMSIRSVTCSIHPSPPRQSEIERFAWPGSAVPWTFGGQTTPPNIS